MCAHQIASERFQFKVIKRPWHSPGCAKYMISHQHTHGEAVERSARQSVATTRLRLFSAAGRAGFAPRNKKVLAGYCGPIVPDLPTRIG